MEFVGQARNALAFRPLVPTFVVDSVDLLFALRVKLAIPNSRRLVSEGVEPVRSYVHDREIEPLQSVGQFVVSGSSRIHVKYHRVPIHIKPKLAERMGMVKERGKIR